jgi:hypothetical protein
MRVTSLLTIPMVLLLGTGLSGCGSSQQAAPTQQPASSQQSGASQSPRNSQQSMPGMDMSQPSKSNPSTSSPSNAQVGKAIQDELNGMKTIEAAVNKGDFDTASKTFEPLHNEYHAAVLPPIQAKNPKLAEDMHSKFDALDSSLDTKDKNKILSAIKTNVDSLNQAAKELGISIQK